MPKCLFVTCTRYVQATHPTFTDYATCQASLAPLVASPHASHPLSTRRLFGKRVFSDCTCAGLSHDQRSRTLDRELVLHGPEARLWFAAPFDQGWVLLSACLDGLRLAISPLRDIIDQSCLPARAAVGVRLAAWQSENLVEILVFYKLKTTKISMNLTTKNNKIKNIFGQILAMSV